MHSHDSSCKSVFLREILLGNARDLFATQADTYDNKISELWIFHGRQCSRSDEIETGPKCYNKKRFDSKWHPFTAAPIIDRQNVDECLLTWHAKTQDKYRLRTVEPTHISRSILPWPHGAVVPCIFHEVIYPSTEELQLVYIVSRVISVIERPFKRAHTWTTVDFING